MTTRATPLSGASATTAASGAAPSATGVSPLPPISLEPSPLGRSPVIPSSDVLSSQGLSPEAPLPEAQSSDALLSQAKARSGQSAPALSVKGLTVTYAETPVLRDLDLIVPQGAMMAIVGPNGAGKSTLIKAAMGLVPRLSGVVDFGGQTLKAARPRIAYVPQRASVDWEFPATVMDVVLMGFYRELGLWRVTTARHRARAMACLTRVGMEDFSSRQIGQLSGGQQQRVFLARALAQDASLYILDEPFAGVDAATERAIIDVLKALNAAGATILAVHHDLATVRDYFDHVVLVNGTALAQGPLDQAFSAENLQRAYGGRLSAGQTDTAAGEAALGPVSQQPPHTAQHGRTIPHPPMTLDAAAGHPSAGAER